jgi:predicted ATPase
VSAVGRRLELMACSVDLDTGALSGGKSGRLTDRELALLRHLVENPEGADREALLKLFGYHASAVSRAVDKAMNSLRAKVERDPAEPDHLVTVWGMGYRFVPCSSPPLVPQDNLGRELDAFVGRGREQERLRSLLQAPGLVTLTGIGGIGKTRLALRVAREHARASGRGAWLCALGQARSRDDLLRSVATSLELALSRGEPADQVGHALAARPGALLLLDNLEHLLEHADLLDRWRALAPETRLVVTTRCPLELRGEQVVPLEPLTPEEGVELLVLRAAARGFDVSGDPDLPALAQSLDGLPLALELAAGRLGLQRPGAILPRLKDRLDLLRTFDRGAEPRLATLRGALDWSWNLLDGPEQTALAELSVFAGGFRLEAAEAVLSSPSDGRTLFEVLDALLRASLLVRRLVEGEVRLELLETVRTYAHEKLEALGSDALRRMAFAHARHFARLGAPEALQATYGPGGPALTRRLQQELDNLLRAARWALRAREGSLAGPLVAAVAFLLRVRGPLAPATEMLGLALALPLGVEERARLRRQYGEALSRQDPRQGRVILLEAVREAEEAGRPALVGAALRALGTLLGLQGDNEEAQRCHARGLQVLPLEELVERSLLLRELGALASHQGDHDEAVSLTQRALELARQAGSARAIGLAQASLGVFLGDQGKLEAAEAHGQAALALFVELGESLNVISLRGNLGMLAAKRGDLQTAAEAYRVCVEEVQRLGDRPLQLLWTVNLAGMLIRMDEFARALPWLDAAEHLARSLGDDHELARILSHRGNVARHMGLLDEALEHNARSEQILREIGYAYDLMFTLCGRVHMLAQRGDREQARLVLHEVEQWALENRPGLDGDLEQVMQELHELLER